MHASPLSQPRPRARRKAVRSQHDWNAATRRALASGALAAVATALYVSRAGARDSGSAVAPLNATSHIAWGDRSHAGSVEHVDARHTVPGLLLHAGACVMWAAIYERYFGATAERGRVAGALAGSGAIAAAAYVTDYHVVPKRFTPGWETRLSSRSLARVYAVLALALPLRGLLRHWRR